DIPEQPARFRYRHVEPKPPRPPRILPAVRPDPGDPGARGVQSRHRLRIPGLRYGLEGHGRRSCAFVRGEINKSGLEVMDRIWDNGFRQTTSSTKPITGPDDLKGFKIRVPVSPLWTSMFKAFDASPASINFSEVYSALQTKIVEGQENPLALI